MAGLKGRTAEAVVQGIAFYDFTHWRRLEDSWSGPCFEIGIGRGYTLEADVDAGSVSPSAEYILQYEDRYQMVDIRAENVSMDEDGLHLHGEGCRADVPFDDSFNSRECRDGYIRPEGAERLCAKYFDREVRTWALSAEGEPWDSDTPAEPEGFDGRFVGILEDAVGMQRFDGLKDRFGRGWGESVGPASFIFEGMAGAPYCSWVHVTVIGGTDDVAEFRISGVLSSDGDGIVIRGDSGAYTIVLEDGGRYADADVRYLAENAFDLSGYVGDGKERLDSVLNRGKEIEMLQEALDPWKEADR